MNQTYKYVEVESTADKALHVEAPTLAGIYAGAAMGMFRLMREPSLPATQSEVKHILVSGIDAESVLVEWLERLLAASESIGWDNGLAEVSIRDAGEFGIQASARFTDNAVPSGAQIKAATFHNLAIVDRGDVEWRYDVTITFDV